MLRRSPHSPHLGGLPLGLGCPLFALSDALTSLKLPQSRRSNQNLPSGLSFCEPHRTKDAEEGVSIIPDSDDRGADSAINWVDMSNWDNEPVPQREWAIRDRVPLNQAGLFSGEGGTGKSILELMKNAAHVTGKEWLGSMPEPGPALYIGAE